MRNEPVSGQVQTIEILVPSLPLCLPPTIFIPPDYFLLSAVLTLTPPGSGNSRYYRDYCYMTRKVCFLCLYPC